MSAPAIEIKDVQKSFGNISIIRNLNLSSAKVVGQTDITNFLSPKTAACMIDPPVALVVDRVVSLNPCRFQLFR